EEKHRSIVSDDVPISLLGIELDSRPADIALGIRCPTFPSNSRKADKHRCLLSYLRKDCRLGVFRDVMSCRESSVCSPAFGMHPPLRNDLAIKMRELLYKPDVL